jgi:hypothetical protein
MPITFVLDPQGVIVRVHIGPLGIDQLRAIKAELSS